jgi:tetratricopeptide (TPR) repeat protein
LLLAPFLVFAGVHVWNTRRRKNRRAVRAGYALLVVCLLLLGSGLLLTRVGGFDLKVPAVRSAVYWLHVLTPLAALWLYWLHRLAGPRIKWRIGAAYAAVTAALVVGLMAFHAQDPRQWNVVGPKEGVKYFEPSLARTSTGEFIPAEVLNMNDYCLKCHADVHAGWSESVHRFSSFNNQAYLASVRETREVALKRDGSVKASRWCAGCHDPVPFFSGAFDDPKFDDVKHPTAHAGITCTVCHAITHVNTTRGNADYTIEEPLHYPFATSKSPFLQWVNNQLVKAKPEFHKKTFLKDFHKTAEFCSTCHKVHLPEELTHYREFLRGQNHYDSFLLSGVSGHGARSFYYPEKAQENCNGCHMPLKESDDFGAKFFGTDKLSIHDHLFPAANTGVAWLRERPEIVQAHQDFLKGTMRVDLMGVREGDTVDGPLTAPLRPEVPTLQPGGTYLLETVIRTLKLGHHFTQGTVDSNEIWLDVVVRSGERVIGRSGATDEVGEVDRWAHFVNVFLLDRDGNRINRRNPQDIFVPLYNNQIPPGAAQLVHYALEVPDDVAAPVTVEVRLLYRKFDREYMDFIARSLTSRDSPLRGEQPGEPYVNRLPVTVLAEDRVTFPVAGADNSAVQNPSSEIPEWMRWNDYGIGALLKGKAELRQAEAAFDEVERLGRYDGPLNLARVYEREGRLDEAADAVRRAAAHDDPAAPPWTVAWLSGVINRQQSRLEEAERNFRQVLDPKYLPADVRERGFDFSLDIEVRNLLGQTLFDQAKQLRTESRRKERDAKLRAAVAEFERTLTVDPEDVTAHYNLQLLYGMLGDEAKEAEHRKLHARYKPDDNARDRAVRLARQKYPAADRASEAVVIYDLQRPEALAAPDPDAHDPANPPMEPQEPNDE